MLSLGFQIFTWGCPCRKGGRPQTWAWEAGCWGWWGRGWSSQTVPTWPAAICGICMIRKVISLDNFQRYQVYSRNENYLQEILTVFIKWIVKRYFEVIRKRQVVVFVEKWMLSPNIINGLLHSLFSDASSEVIVHTQKEEIVLLYISLICVVVALFITRKSVSLLFFLKI